VRSRLQYVHTLPHSCAVPPSHTLSDKLLTCGTQQVLVTPLGALSVLIGAILAAVFLKEELGRIGVVGCALCLLGSLVIVLHAPEDKDIKTVDEILNYAMSPGEGIVRRIMQNDAWLILFPPSAYFLCLHHQ